MSSTSTAAGPEARAARPRSGGSSPAPAGFHDLLAHLDHRPDASTPGTDPVRHHHQKEQ